MIRSFYGLTQNPFDRRELELLPQQREIHDTLKVHCQQGGLCLVLGSLPAARRQLREAVANLDAQEPINLMDLNVPPEELVQAAIRRVAHATKATGEGT